MSSGKNEDAAIGFEIHNLKKNIYDDEKFLIEIGLTVQN